MRKAKILFRNEEAGILTQLDDGSFTFRYHDAWCSNLHNPSISLTLPKSKKVFRAEFLFPFFYNMLPEGSNKLMACRLNRIDHEDAFGLLMTTAMHDSIGAVRVIKIMN